MEPNTAAAAAEGHRRKKRTATTHTAHHAQPRRSVHLPISLPLGVVVWRRVAGMVVGEKRQRMSCPGAGVW